jgi:hypothetical protein
MSKHDSLRAAQLAVMKDIGYVQKKGKVGSGNYGYTYAGEKELINELRPVMLKHGIVMYPDTCEVVKTEDYTTGKGHRMSLFLGKRRFVFEHVNSGDQAFVEVFAEAADQGDKRASKAMTLAKKYALREFFLIETGDDPDAQVSTRSARIGMFDKAKNALQSCMTLDDLKVKWDAINGYKEAEWTGTQVQELVSLYKTLTEKLGE